MMGTRTARTWAAVLLGAMIASGCRCGPQTTRREPEIEVSPLLIDFGTVQVNVEHTADLRIYNAGADTLNVAEFRVTAPYSVLDAPPSIGAGQEQIVKVAFTPTEVDKRVSAQLVIASDDPARPEVTVDLVGAGISSQARAQPEVLDFGDVWVGESKTLDLTIVNSGTNTLTVKSAGFAAGTPSTIGGTITNLVGDIEPGTSKKAQVTFGPTAITTDLPGAVRLELNEEDGSELVVPFKGRGVRAVPRLCFRLDGSPMEQCTDANASGSNPGNLVVTIPPLCDSVIYPPDGGTSPSACGGAPYEMSGQFYVRNEGNVPVKYSLQYKAATGKSCDGGTPEQLDFQFANAPDAGTIQWTVPTVQLPLSEMDPMPWESGAVKVTYSASANCLDEAADQAQIFWTRQGDSRQPFVLSTVLTGSSRLPNAESHTTTFTGKSQAEVGFKGAINRGSAEFSITSAEYHWLVVPTEQETCAGPDAGLFQSCQGFENDPTSWCYLFGWADGGSPTATGPHVIPIADGGTPGEAEIGRLVYDPHTAAKLNTPACVYVVLETTDPFNPVIISRVQGTRNQ